MAYSDLLKDPRWQKKRLEILNRDKFTCTYCGDDTTTLHVHHMRYSKGKKPWDYHNDLLKTLCEPCHRLVSEGMTEALDILCDAIKVSEFHPKDIISIAKSIEQMKLCHMPEVVASAYAFSFSDYDTQCDLLDRYFEHLRTKQKLVSNG
jgi:hypothetical protein